MKSASLNIAGKIDPRIVTVLDAVSQAAAELEMPYVVVGATARDLVLHYGHGARIQRATRDVDFAIQVPNWAAFNALKDYLCQRGFETTAALQRLVSPANTVLDIVPFGPIEDDRATIAWPPAGEIVMSVLGFREALESAEQVRIRDEPALDVPVATPAGMMLLKLIAWTDRPADLRRKDAMDIAYLLASYDAIHEVRDALYADANMQIMETYDWDVTLAAAHLLGAHARSIAGAKTRQTIARLAAGSLRELTPDRLTGEMRAHNDNEYERNQQLLSAFLSGFLTGTD